MAGKGRPSKSPYWDPEIGGYPEDYKERVVDEIEFNGVDPKKIAEEDKVGVGTLRNWYVKRYGEESSIRHFGVNGLSAKFKRSIADEILDGKSSMADVQKRLPEVPLATITKWVNRVKPVEKPQKPKVEPETPSTEDRMLTLLASIDASLKEINAKLDNISQYPDPSSPEASLRAIADALKNGLTIRPVSPPLA